MKHLSLIALCLVACSSSSDPTPTSDAGDDASDAAASFEGGVCGLTGAICGETISTPCCTGLCAIGELAELNCK